MTEANNPLSRKRKRQLPSNRSDELSKKSKKAARGRLKAKTNGTPNGESLNELLEEKLPVPRPVGLEGKDLVPRKKRSKKVKGMMLEADAVTSRAPRAPRTSPMVVSKPIGGRMANIDSIITSDEQYDASTTRE